MEWSRNVDSDDTYERRGCRCNEVGGKYHYNTSTRTDKRSTRNNFTEALRSRMMEGDTKEDISSYMSAGEMTTATLINTRIGDRVQDAHTSRQRYRFVSSRRVRDLINVIPMETTRERKQ